jgi:glycosyltransferase involved in cell wall biosynthesis
MSLPRIGFLVHGGPASIEAARARGLTRHYPADKVHFLFREADRRTTARRWHAQIKALHPDLLYVVNTALPGTLLACWWKWRHRLPFILDTGDVVYEMARTAGTCPAWKLPLMEHIESMAQNAARAVVVRGNLHKKLLMQRGLNEVELLRDGYVEHPEPDPAALDELRTQLGLGGKFVAGMMGSLVHSPRLDICYGWDLVDALALLPEPAVQGLIIGDGPGRRWLEMRALEKGVLTRLTFCGRVPYEKVPLYLRLLDVALSTQTNNLPGQVRTTGKLPEYMAAGRYILASRVGEAASLLPEEMLLDYEGEVDTLYPRLLANEIRRLCQNRELLAAGQKMPAIAAQHCSYEVLSRQFVQFIEEVTGNRT